jgi:hypothetical protein
VINLSEAIRTHLLANVALAALVQGRVYAERSSPPAGYRPDQGPCVCLLIRGGLPEYSGLLQYPSVQLKCYGTSIDNANAVYRAVFAALHETRAGTVVRWGQLENLGQTLLEPDQPPGSPWYFVLTFVRMFVGIA